MRYGSVYLLTNRHTGEQYVGQTIKSVKKRWYAHCMSAQKPKFKVSHNIAKYGKDAFDVSEMFVAFDKDALNGAEKALIATFNPALNLTSGGAGLPRKLTEKERLALSERSKKLWADPVWKARTIAGLKNAERPVVPYEVLRERGKATCAKRWANHVKRKKEVVGTGALTAKTWQDPMVRAKRIQGIIEANARPEVQERRKAASTGRVMPKEAIAKAARAKWKPVYCPELQVSFLSQKHAAEFLGVKKTSVCNALKTKGKVKQKFTLAMVA